MLFVVLCSSQMNSMGDGVVKSPSTSGPRYVPPVKGQELFCGKVYDEKSIVKLRELSFSGHASIDGLRTEIDDSLTTINLADYKEIVIKQQLYQCKRYVDKEFTLISLVSKNDKNSKDYLAPRNIVICGIEKETNAEKAWFLKKIDRITIESNNEAPAEETNYAEKIFKKQPPAQEAQTLLNVAPTQPNNPVNLLDQTMTSTAIPMNASTIIKVDHSIVKVEPEQKTIWQAMTGIFNDILILIKAILAAVKKLFRWFW